MYLLADYEALDRLVWAFFAIVFVASIVVGGVAGGILAAVKKNRWHLWWAPAIGLLLFLAVATWLAITFGF